MDPLKVGGKRRKPVKKVVTKSKKTTHPYSCPTCGRTRFKTIQKGSSYECRDILCGQVIVKDLEKFERDSKW